MNMQESLATLVSASAILDVKLTLCCSVEGLMHAIRPFTEWLVRAHPVHSDFRLSEPVDCYVDNLKNGVILSYINYEIKIVAIQKSVLYIDGNLVIILSTFSSPENDRRKRLSRFCKRYL